MLEINKHTETHLENIPALPLFNHIKTVYGF